MKIQRLEEFDKNQIVSSYAVCDIFDLLWAFIRYGKMNCIDSHSHPICF